MSDALIVRRGGEVDTTDATMTASDLASGKTGYANGVKLTGNLESLIGWDLGTAEELATDSTGVVATGYTHKKAILIAEAPVDVKLLFSSFGNALPSDVKSGKRFSSSAGFSILGTSTAIETGDATATAADIASGKTSYVAGVKVTGNNVPKHIATGTGISDPKVSGLSFNPTWAMVFLASNEAVGQGFTTGFFAFNGNAWGTYVSNGTTYGTEGATFNHSLGSFSFSNYFNSLQGSKYNWICGD